MKIKNRNYAALLVPTGYKYNISSIVEKYVNQRMVAVTSLDYVLDEKIENELEE